MAVRGVLVLCLWMVVCCNSQDLSCRTTLCPQGYECTMENGKPNCIPQKVDVCGASGDPHHTTFDARYFDFMGTCTYTLVNVTKDAEKSLKRFTVLAKNDNRGNVAVSYVALVTFKTSGYTIDIKKGEVGSVRVNNVMSLLPVTLNSGTDSMITIFQSGNTAIIQFTTAVRISYDWNSVVRIELTRIYSKNVEGMCGNYNQDPDDDFQIPSGSQAPNAIEFGKSWKVDDGTECWDDCNGPCLTCLAKLAETFKTDDYCGILTKKDGPFSECHALVDPSRYMDNCVYDVCLNDGDRKLLCEAIKDYVDTCQRAGAKISDWRKVAGCPLDCPENSRYVLCGRECAPTCQEQESSLCSKLCVEQCQCDPGFLLIGGKCLSKENCGCFFNGRSYAPNQSFWGDDTCTQKCICNEKSKEVECSRASCSVREECSVRDGLRDCYPPIFA
ncbi:Hypothetical predicted protein [Pelobates cultripes]|nr:Hypothetical predicted protein [Pelobates cultripes]